MLNGTAPWLPVLIRRDELWANSATFDRGDEVSEAPNSYQCCNLGHDLLKSVS